MQGFGGRFKLKEICLLLTTAGLSPLYIGGAPGSANLHSQQQHFFSSKNKTHSLVTSVNKSPIVPTGYEPFCRTESVSVQIST